MSILAPLGALALLALPAILLLYFLKVRRPEVRVATLMFWRPFLADRQANAPWQRLRGSLLLALQLLAALALAVALLRPGVSGAAGIGATTVVLLDGSASMAATDVSPTRFDAAVARTRQLASQLGPGQQLAVVLLGRHAVLLAAPSNDPAVLGAALDRARPTGGEVDLGEGLSLANAVAAGRPGASIILLGDGHAKAPPAPPRLNAPLIYEPFGVSGDNVGIETLSRTRAGTVFVRLANYGRTDRDVRVEFFSDGRLADVLPARVAGNATIDLTWTGLGPGTRIVEARVTPEDAFAIDNSAWLVTGSPPARKVLLVTDENGFLERALGLRPGIDLTVQKKADYKSGASYDLYVFDGWTPPGRLPEPALVVGPPEGTGPVPAGAAMNPGLVLPADQRDPLTQDVVLRDVHVQSAARVVAPAGWRVVIGAVDDPLLLVHDGEPRVAELTFDIHHSDLPLRAAFPILVQNLLGYLLPGGFENQVFPTGRPVSRATEPGARSLEVATPGGRTIRLAPPFPAAPFTDTDTPGVYTVRQQLPQGLRVSQFVVQFANPGLSRIAPGPAPLVEESARPGGPVPKGTLELWPWLAVAGLLLLTGEWFVFHRGP
ncbi:MAG: BatA and WFA domain-containing protein [Candidatus Dormibacteraceae bacterium]